MIVCHYVCHYGNNACHYGNTVSVRKHCHHRNRNTVCHYGNTVCHYGNNVCMSLREHHVYVITGTPCVCHHGNTVCMSSREHRVYVIMGIPSVSHHGNTVCRSSREHRVYVITGTPCVCHHGKTICFSQCIATERGVCTCIKDVLSKPNWHHSPSSDYRPAPRQGSRQSLPCGVDRTQCPTRKPRTIRCWPNPVSHTAAQRRRLRPVSLQLHGRLFVVMRQ